MITTELTSILLYAFVCRQGMSGHQTSDKFLLSLTFNFKVKCLEYLYNAMYLEVLLLAGVCKLTGDI